MKKVLFIVIFLNTKRLLKKSLLLDVYNSDKNILTPNKLIKQASGFNGIICQGNNVMGVY